MRFKKKRALTKERYLVYSPLGVSVCSDKPDRIPTTVNAFVERYDGVATTSMRRLGVQQWEPGEVCRGNDHYKTYQHQGRKKHFFHSVSLCETNGGRPRKGSEAASTGAMIQDRDSCCPLHSMALQI